MISVHVKPRDHSVHIVYDREPYRGHLFVGAHRDMGTVKEQVFRGQELIHEEFFDADALATASGEMLNLQAYLVGMTQTVIRKETL